MVKTPSELPTADELEELGDDNDFERRGDVDVCKHCGAVKEGTSAFFKKHMRECIEPRKRRLRAR